ncbi:methyl-accepting chemotaxis transducer [Richelia sinica FACHB-800]|uniref:Methyl-accepting chemotaxis transducer n=1 Tax=Richelia sinica FACHB-800 TaxID=1357546 RepID=A0A975T3I1_9NOST|nr:CHASE3 domain-containing protein [Richelia sinica]MBD2667136.1 methyl-accepting chemotaxis protein [Richelia sinica FACHB-800]QXE21561.1 methyl-accepting chemotaxis transducer [Richelia sinica FACHB-800]
MQQSLKLNQFVLGGCGVIVIFTCITSFIAQSTNTQIRETNNHVNSTYEIKADLKGLEKTLVDAETGQRGFVITKKEEYLEPFNQAKTQLNEKIVDLKQQFNSEPKNLQMIAEIETLSREKFKELEATIALKRAGKDKELLELILSNQGKKKMDQIREIMDGLIATQDQILEAQKRELMQIQSFSSLVIWGNLLCIIITVVIVSLAIILIPGRALSQALQNAFTLADKVSAGDLTVDIEVTSTDVIGKLMSTLKNMADNLSNLIRQIQKSGIQVTSSATQIAASGKQLEASITEQLASTNEVTAAAKQISATSRELVKTVEEVATMSQVTTVAANESQKDLLKMESTMRQLLEATNSIAARLGVISEKANNINNIVVTITKVADQTNLLSLNAAIEAEKAGEYGLGFAVVAREIRRLADQTAVATIDIEQMVKQMQSSVSTGVMEMDKFATEVSRSVEDVANISMQMGQIIEQVQDLTPRYEAVSQGMEAQAQGATQISDAMSQLSSNSVQTAASLREINQAIAQLNQIAQGLRQEMSRFKLNQSFEADMNVSGKMFISN